MKDCTVSKYPICTLLDEFFAQEEIRNVITEYQNKNSKISKWLMFSDYCLEDKNKSNDVMTFVLYCCPVNFKTPQIHYPQCPSIGVADFFLEK